MSGVDTLKARLTYQGGIAQKDRMKEDKLKSLKNAYLYSYQGATAILQDGREFRCLINPDTIKKEFDNKYLSIPFQDICLNSKDKTEQSIDIKAGDIITWKENGTKWLVYLRRFEETAYFRAELRRSCFTTKIGEKEYSIYAGFPHLDPIDWRKSNGKTWNELDYSLVVYIKKDENTLKNIHRFSILTIDNNPWEVQAVDTMSTEGILIIALREYYKNSIKEELEKEEKPIEPVIPEGEPYIEGPKILYPYDEASYIIRNAEGGQWFIDSPKCEILSQNEKDLKISVKTGRSTNFTIKYRRENKEDILLKITVDSI